MPDDLLDHVTEIELAIRVEAGVLAREARLSETSGVDPADLAAIEARGTEAQQRFVSANLGLVAQTAAEMARRSHAVQADLFQEGCLGLIEAVRRYDHTRGVRFSTYALHLVRAAVSAAALAARTGPGFSAFRAREQRRLRAVANDLGHRLGRVPTVAEVAEADGRDQGWVAATLNLDDATPFDRLDDELLARAWTDQTPAEIWRGAELVDQLPAQLATVLRLRYGFGVDARPQSRPAVARTLGLSIAVVRRLEREGLDALRAATPYALRELLE